MAASAGTVLRCVLDHGPIARSTIARTTGLSPASVTGQSAQLARLGLLRELPETGRLRTVGRPHVPVDLDISRYIVGAIHVSVPHTTTALLDLRGRVIARQLLPHTSTDPSSIVRRACDAARVGDCYRRVRRQRLRCGDRPSAARLAGRPAA